MSKPVIVVDPGHGGHDSGAVSNGARESDIVLKVGFFVTNFLASYDCRVVMTRVFDTFLSLQERRTLTNESKATAFVSIHCNFFNDPAAHGFEYYTTPGTTRSDKLATRMIDRHSAHFLDQRLRTDRSDGDADKEANFAVLRCHAPAVLAEFGFISNAKEREMMLRESKQKAFAQCMGFAIVDEFKLKKKINGVATSPVPKPSQLPEMIALGAQLARARVAIAEMTKAINEAETALSKAKAKQS